MAAGACALLIGAACGSARPADPGGLTGFDRTATASALIHTTPQHLTAPDLTATALAGSGSAHATPLHIASTPVAQPGLPWPMFRQNEQHTAVISGAGSISSDGPAIRWAYPLLAPRTRVDMRWASGFPLGDLDGDGSLEVVVTSPDNAADLSPRVIVLKDTPGQPTPVSELWTYIVPGGERAGVDQYSAALADADGDGRLDVIFTARDGYIRALKGATGELIWQFNTGRIMEAGPMVADLDGDGSLELIQVTDCVINGCPSGGALFVFKAIARGENRPLWSLELPWKSDSGEPAIADLDPADNQSRKAIIFGSWGGRLTVAWQDPSGSIVRGDFDLRQLDPAIPQDSDKVVVRSSPLIVDWGDGPTAVFGWMPDHDIGTEARLSAIALQADMRAGTIMFTPRWTVNQDAWKSSPALVPVGDSFPLVVVGTGVGVSVGTSFECQTVIGSVAAYNSSGEVVWENDLRPQGNVRGSAAVADVDGDGRPEVIVPIGCGGDLVAYDGGTGREEWRIPLGAFTFTSPSIGDLDGDGALEIVIASYDGNVYVLGGR